LKPRSSLQWAAHSQKCPGTLYYLDFVFTEFPISFLPCPLIVTLLNKQAWNLAHTFEKCWIFNYKALSSMGTPKIVKYPYHIRSIPGTHMVLVGYLQI
jgi:hypothetical protein